MLSVKALVAGVKSWKECVICPSRGLSARGGISLRWVAEAYLSKLPSQCRRSLMAGVGGRSLRLGTLCSGTDAPAAVCRALCAALPGVLEVEHCFSCENSAKKRAWILQNFREVPHIFGDVRELCNDVAFDYVSNEFVLVPSVDIVVAGFVCKSVSAENNKRHLFSDCIRDVSGSTGETFKGVMDYVRRFRPLLVICENVAGLVKRNHGASPVINDVAQEFATCGYAFGYRLLDTRDYLLPQRRQRCWMWAFRERHGTVPWSVARVIEALAGHRTWPLDALFRAAGVACPSCERPLNLRERDVVDVALAKLPPGELGAEVLVDVAKSVKFAPACVGSSTCILPNSRPFRVRQGHVLSAEQVHAVQDAFYVGGGWGLFFLLFVNFVAYFLSSVGIYMCIYMYI